jgi:hypothetical protein
MKRNLLIAMLLSITLFSCRPKVIYVDRPVTTNPNNISQAPATNDNQPYQQPAQTPQVNDNGVQQQYNNNNTAQNTNQQQYNNQQQDNSQQQYNGQNNYKEADQQYYANQQQVNYGAPSYQTFYDELSPYGSWIRYGDYNYVWCPAQGPDFTPYSTNGYWAYSEYGWTWVSNYNWGWAPFHYGRWMRDASIGWLWVPGNTWAPAWVTWGQYNGYYGWAPIGPNVNNYDGYRPPVDQWCFVPKNYITDHEVYNHVVNHQNNTVIINNNVTNITIINNYNTYNSANFNAGPRRENVETATGHKVQPMTISVTNKPLPANQRVNNNNISIYRPAINTTVKSEPAHTVSVQNVKEVNATAIHGALPHTNVNTSPANNNGGLRINPSVRPNEPRPLNSQQEKPTEQLPNHNIPQRETPSQPVQPRTQEPPLHVEPQTPQRVQPQNRQPEAPLRVQPQPERAQPVRNQTPNTNSNLPRPSNQNKPRPQPRPAPRPASRPQSQPERK